MTKQEIVTILRHNPSLADKVLSGVPTLDKYAFCRKHGINAPKLSNQMVGLELGLTRERVRQLIAGVFNKLTHHSRINIIKEYVGQNTKANNLS